MGQVRAQEHSERARQAQNSPESRAWTEHGQSRTPPCRYHTCRMPSTVAMAPPYTRTPGTSRKLGAPGKKASSREDWQPAGQQAAKGGPIADDWALQLLAGRGCAADCTSHQLTPEVILLQDCVGAEHSAAPLGDQRCVLVLLGTVLPLLGLACRAEGSAGDAQQGDAQLPFPQPALPPTPRLPVTYWLPAHQATCSAPAQQPGCTAAGAPGSSAARCKTAVGVG